MVFLCPLQVLWAAQMHWLLPHWFYWLQVFHLNWKVKKWPVCNFAALFLIPGMSRGLTPLKKWLKDWEFYRETLVSTLSYDKSQALAFESTVCLSWRFTSLIGHRAQLLLLPSLYWLQHCCGLWLWSGNILMILSHEIVAICMTCRLLMQK